MHNCFKGDLCLIWELICFLTYAVNKNNIVTTNFPSRILLVLRSTDGVPSSIGVLRVLLVGLAGEPCLTGCAGRAQLCARCRLVLGTAA